MMHDEVSDTENIRKNLAIERMIVEGCDILLDTSQTFVRQGESHKAATYFHKGFTFLCLLLHEPWFINTSRFKYLYYYFIWHQ